MKAVVILLGLILYAGLEPPLEQERELSAQCEELEKPLDLRTSAPYELQLPTDHDSSLALAPRTQTLELEKAEQSEKGQPSQGFSLEMSAEVKGQLPTEGGPDPP